MWLDALSDDTLSSRLPSNHDPSACGSGSSRRGQRGQRQSDQEARVSGGSSLVFIEGSAFGEQRTREQAQGPAGDFLMHSQTLLRQPVSPLTPHSQGEQTCMCPVEL